MSVSNFTLPDVGEGLTEAEIVEWKVAPGDTVAINQVLVEIETAKSLVELPSPYVGVVGEILVQPGTTVDVGTVIITIVSDAAGAAAEAGDSAAPAAELAGAAADAGSTITAEPAEAQGAVLAGRGPAATMPTRRKRHGGFPVAHESIAPPPVVRARPGAAPVALRPRSASAGPVVAKPPIRKLAKDLG
ncbi:MAG: 2-oxo acid dehydrogenase subunit E2, partial [Ramlibacter sp.]|nr:2-oxo acid dehydrogenase subunit E2 [Cryobacterium sp.]